MLGGFSLDISILSSGFCLYHISFVVSLLYHTLGLVVVLLLLFLISRFNRTWKRGLLQTGIYVLLFSYPAVARKIAEAYSCHLIDGIFYMRADYDALCYDSAWWFIAYYASGWLVIYVIGLPLVVLCILFRYHRRLQGNRVIPATFRFAFLLDDYKLSSPALLWDGIGEEIPNSSPRLFIFVL